MHKKIKSMLSIMLISTLSFTAVGCGNEASQEGVSAVFGTMESEDGVVDNITDTSEPQVVAENSDTQATEEDTQVKEDTQVEENDSQETSSESSKESKDNSNTGSSKSIKEIKEANGAIWVKSPTGWMCAVGSTGKVFIK